MFLIIFLSHLFANLILGVVVVDCVKIAQSKQIVEILNDPLRYDKHLTPTQGQGWSEILMTSMFFMYTVPLFQSLTCTLMFSHLETLDDFVETEYTPRQLKKLFRMYRYCIIDAPTLITIGMYVEGMSSIRAQTMDFHIDIYLEQRWIDSRLKHTNPHRVLIKDIHLLEKMWHPDLYFANANSAKTFDVTSPNFLMWIFPDGTVHYDMRISLTVLCNMDFTKYPLDTQQCDMRILSYAYTTDQLKITWRKNNPIDMNQDLKLPDMNISDVEAQFCNGTYENGEWSCVKAVFKMRREKMHHILQNYVPTVLIVIISWFSFWLDVDSVPGRVSLCITTLLTLATHATSARLSLPQVSYAKAIDVWLEACLGFVFGVLIEFTIVNYLARVEDETDDDSSSSQDVNLHLTPLNDVGAKKHCSECEYFWTWKNISYYFPNRTTKRQMAFHIDMSSRWAFPLLFVIFNICYWIYYICIA